MLINKNYYPNINFLSYQRVFIFGCSFTNFPTWITWANIISLECRNAQIYNLGQPGGGNLFISCRLSEANQKYKFGTDDLILVMWSTHCREDRYKDDKWITSGNVWGQNTIPIEFIRDWACVRGYIVRDYGLMSLSESAFNNLECHSIFLKSVDIDLDGIQCFLDLDLTDIKDCYKDYLEMSPEPMSEILGDKQNGFPVSHSYFYKELTGNEKEKFGDRHPTPTKYLQYLLKIGIPISEETKQVVDYYNSNVLNTDNFADLTKIRNDFMSMFLPNNTDNPKSL